MIMQQGQPQAGLLMILLNVELAEILHVALMDQILA